MMKIYDDSKNYTAQVIKLPVKQPVQGLDNLVEVNVFGNSCLIGKDSPEDELYLFFPAGTQLSQDFVKANNLYREQQANADISQKGFFELNRRVKAIKFRGIISSGFVIPISSLDIVLSNVLNDTTKGCYEFNDSFVGTQFNEIYGVEICRKYQLPVNTQSQGAGDKASKINNKLANLLIPNQFRFHNETSHLANNLHVLNPDDIIVITDKWHGSSCILSKVYVAKKLNLRQRIINFFGGQIPDREYGYIYSSGKPKSNLPKGIAGSWINDGIDYYTDNIWSRAHEDFNKTLENGISLYGELVGYTEGGQFIQKGYDYGCSQTITHVEGSSPTTTGTYKFVVYRITYTKPDGTVIEFSWQQIKEYCKKYNLETVKELYFGKFKDFLETRFGSGTLNDIPTPVTEFFEYLQQFFVNEKKCIYCTTGVPSEGITVRIDGKQSYSTYKLKSKLFLKKESDDLDKGEINIEDNP